MLTSGVRSWVHSGRAAGRPKPAFIANSGLKALRRQVEQRSLTTIREKLVKIEAEVVGHGRYVTFQMAAVAVSRDLFRGILRLIDGLRGPSPVTE